MNAEQRRRGRKIRQVLRLDRAWRAEGKVEGRTENALAWRMGQAHRMGVGADMERARRRASRKAGK
ncbi:hypothetical protein [Phytohabitans rumicis]|uniref:Uncharacterized protein n=1 Tax=Phytohabitans rumicis TaxID=1076125 RepID=A0A6V8LBS1_9ACTN|nr:hypothetical protein [Phytohabitans rumicis]GFJ92458.1 hypothetical protein Prum_061000 [Phytohabitans rumicis]